MTDPPRDPPRGWLQRLFARRATIDAPGSQWLEGELHVPRALNYRLFVPGGLEASAPAPLLLMLHGCNQTALEFAQGTRMNSWAQRDDCLVVYPQQSKAFNTLRCWNWFDPETLAGRGETAVMLSLIHHLQQQYRIDPERIYVAGLSAGGALAAVLCALHPELFAACAVHSGLMFQAADSPIDAYRAMQSGVFEAEAVNQRVAAARRRGTPVVPTLVIHGDRDGTVNPLNAQQLTHQLQLVAQQAQELAPQALNERHGHSGGRAFRQLDVVQGNRLVISRLLIDQLDHAWSGGDARERFFDTAGPDASELILDFLLQHRRKTA